MIHFNKATINFSPHAYVTKPLLLQIVRGTFLYLNVRSFCSSHLCFE